MGKKNKISWLKVAAGYTVLLAVLLYSLYYLQREVATLVHTDNRNTEWIDSLAILLQEKEKNTVRILHILTEVNDSLVSTSRFESIVTDRDTMQVRPRVQHRVVSHRDTLVTQHERKGFFRRLRDAFIPPKTDSSIQVKTEVEYTVDTVLEAYNPVDTLRQRLRAVMERERRADTLIRRRKRQLQAVNAGLSARIDTLLRSYENDMLLNARNEAVHQSEVRRQSAETIAGIAVGAVLLAAFFSILIGRDIGRNNRYRRELEEARRQAEDLLAARERMMLTITHDFKAPLGSIIGYADLMSRLDQDPRTRFYLENMRTSSEHLLKLVTDLLEFNRLDLHKADINRVPFHPVRLLEEISVSFRPLTAAKGLELRTRISPELADTYVSDPLRIRQIVTNLLSNAVKFTDKGSITLAASWAEGRLVLSVTDTGRGMDPADKERIFREFTRLPGAQGQEGFGLGLSIVRMLVRLLGGTINVESEPGKGSTFTVNLPLSKPLGNEGHRIEEESTPRKANEEGQAAVAPEAGKLPPLPAADENQPAAASSLKRLLLIDDDRIQLTLTAAMLDQAGIKTTACMQVDEVLEALRNEDYDLLLTDVQMPALNGFDLVRLLRASNIPRARTIPIVAVTARSDMQLAELAAHGFAGCLHKPFTVRELLDELARIDNPEKPVPAAPPPPPKETKGIDLSALTAFSTDDPEASRAILRSFAAETRANIDRLRKAVDKGDADKLSAVAHKMIPLFTLIGAADLVGRLRRLEAAKGKPLSTALRSLVPQVSAEVEQILNEVKLD